MPHLLLLLREEVTVVVCTQAAGFGSDDPVTLAIPVW